jgi:hypothetical protein
MRVSLQSFDLVLVLMTMGPAAGCGLGPDVHGTVNITTGTQASQAMKIDGCYSSPTGLTLTSSGRAILDVVGGDAPSITLESGAGSVASSTPQLNKADCASLQVDTHEQSSGQCTGDCDGDDPDGTEIVGSVHARCTLPSGGALQADVTFSGC